MTTTKTKQTRNVSPTRRMRGEFLEKINNYVSVQENKLANGESMDKKILTETFDSLKAISDRLNAVVKKVPDAPKPEPKEEKIYTASDVATIAQTAAKEAVKEFLAASKKAS